MVSMKEYVLNLNEKSKTTLDFLLSNCPQVLKIFYDKPVKYYFWRFWYMITCLWHWVQLSIYSIRALFHKYFVAMKYRRICQFLVKRKSTFN